MKPSRPSNDGSSAILTHESKFAPIDQIGELPADDYVGLIDEEAVAQLMVRLDVESLHNAIWVRQNGNAAKTRFSVIAGRHRLRAARALGWTEIKIEIRASASADRADLKRLQLAENLDRRTLRPIERACFIMERWADAAKALPSASQDNQQTQAIRSRWSVLAATGNTPTNDRKAADAAAANLTGESPRNVRVYRSIFEKLVAPFPDHFALVNAHPLGASLSAIQTLAALRHNDQRLKAITVLLDPSKDWQNMQEVLVAAGLAMSTGNRVDPRNHRATISNTWEKMPLSEKRAYLLEDLPRHLTEKMAQDLVVKLVNSFEGLRRAKP